MAHGDGEAGCGGRAEGVLDRPYRIAHRLRPLAGEDRDQGEDVAGEGSPQHRAAQGAGRPVDRADIARAVDRDADETGAGAGVEAGEGGAGLDLGLVEGLAVGEVGEQGGGVVVAPGADRRTAGQAPGDDRAVRCLRDAYEGDHAAQGEEGQAEAAGLVRHLGRHGGERAADLDGESGGAPGGQFTDVSAPGVLVGVGQAEAVGQQQFAAVQEVRALVHLAGVDPAHRAVQRGSPCEEFGLGGADRVEGEDVTEGECGHGCLPRR